MDNQEPVIYTPRDGETLEQYLDRYTLEEKQLIAQFPEKLTEFCTVVLETSWPSEHDEESTERGLQNLWNILRRMDDCDHLLYYINMLEPIRRELLELLASSAREMNTISKWCTFGRLLGCTVDTFSTVSGLYAAQSGSSYANVMFRIATSFGLLGLASTIAEMKISKDTYYDLVQKIQRDQEFFSPIQRWYQKSTELETAMKNVFPFDLTDKIVKEFTEIGDSEIPPVMLLSRLLMAIAQQDGTRLKDKGLIRNLVKFTKCPSSQELCEWIVFKRQHPVILDMARMLLQLYYSPLRFLMCQSVRALAPGNQTIYSFPVWGRIGLNTVTIFDSIGAMWRCEVSGVFQMQQLERHLRSELIALRRIVNFIQSRRQP